MELSLLYGQERVTFSLEQREGKYLYRDQNGSLELEIKEISPGVLSILVEEKSFLAAVVREKNKIFVAIEGIRFEFQEVEAVSGERRREEISTSGVIAIKAPMPGKVVRVVVGEGDKVKRNQTLAIVEAMKMENEIKASVEGVIKKVYVAEGDLVDSEKALLELEAFP
ncbi:MAG: biotin/lipoyl-binding protein [Candidatus Aminicenantes bacterium]|nr:biotin/lipoyl-binding protein [Candidatus Aminicenantes bacterium]